MDLMPTSNKVKGPAAGEAKAGGVKKVEGVAANAEQEKATAMMPKPSGKKSGETNRPGGTTASGSSAPVPTNDKPASANKGADRVISIFPVQLTTCRIGNLTRLIHTLAICVAIHTYVLSDPPAFRDGVHLYRHISLKFAGLRDCAFRWCSPPRARGQRAKGG